MTLLNTVLVLTTVFCFSITFNSNPSNLKGVLAFRIFPIILGIAALSVFFAEIGILYVELNMPHILR